MAIYRQIHVSFWQDGFVLDLTPEEKYFYLYLMSNSKTSQCGIYELPKRIIETETGYNRETIDKLLTRFIDYGKILYDEETKEIMILNWLKHNKMNSPKVKACILKELQEIKNTQFINAFYRLSKQYGYSIDTLSKVYGEEEELEEKELEEKELEEKKEQEQEVTPSCSFSDPIQNVYKTFENEGYGTISITIAERLQSYIDDYSETFVINALEEGSFQGKRRLSYVDSILKNWKADGMRRSGGNGTDRSFSTNYHGEDRAIENSVTGGKVGWINKPSDFISPTDEDINGLV